ncbi:DUF1661 domain-containing protein [Porphyromonas gingivalis]|uniref:DUF1661 domain-containing protein n=1 Tax=Porphyromonas gingivalis TaxID=837 RepID=UPI000F6245FD|nr:DUF1661 domain-containing protein [Porphyromonas gingivalis]RRG13445.1 DUF1661 domain-containing protein [Porphyromonas gingivalis]
MARELKFFGTTAKKISRRFLRIYRPQSEHFRFVIHRRDRFYRIEIRERISVELIGLVGETFLRDLSAPTGSSWHTRQRRQSSQTGLISKG